jgi:hypothetical protein
MSTVFLPFITETSSEEAIFKSILQRTKGSNTASIANLFSIVLAIGIKKVREKLDDYPSNLSTTAKIRELVANHHGMHVQKVNIDFWLSVMRFERTSNTPHPVFSEKDLEIFFSVLAENKPESLEAAGFNIGHEKYLKFKDSAFDTHAKTFENIKITEKDSQRVGFTSWEEFKAFIAHKSDSPDEIIRVLPVYIDKHLSEVERLDYADKSCVSPYKEFSDES